MTVSDVFQRCKWGEKENKKYKDQYSSGPFPVPVEVTRRSLSPPPPRCCAVPFNLSREVETFSCLLTSLPYQQVSGDRARGGRVSRSEERKSLESVILSVCFCLACFPTICFQCRRLFAVEDSSCRITDFWKALCCAIVPYTFTHYPRPIPSSLWDFVVTWVLSCKVEFGGNASRTLSLPPKGSSQKCSAAMVSKHVHPQKSLFLSWQVNKKKKIPYRQLIRRKMEPLPWFSFNADKSAASTEQKRQILGKWMWLNAKIAFAWQEKLTFPFYLHGIAFIIWILCYFCLCFIALVLCYLSNVIVFCGAAAPAKFPSWKQHFISPFIKYISLSCWGCFHVSINHKNMTKEGGRRR